MEKQIKLKQKIKGESNLPSFKKISGNNIDMEGGKMYLSSMGLIKLEFTLNEIDSTYFIVRKAETEF